MESDLSFEEVPHDLFIASFKTVTGMTLSLVCPRCETRMLLQDGADIPPRFRCGCGNGADAILTLEIAHNDGSQLPQEHAKE